MDMQLMGGRAVFEPMICTQCTICTRHWPMPDLPTSGRYHRTGTPADETQVATEHDEPRDGWKVFISVMATGKDGGELLGER